MQIGEGPVVSATSEWAVSLNGSEQLQRQETVAPDPQLRIDHDHMNHGTDEDGGRDSPHLHQGLPVPRDLLLLLINL